MQIKIPLDNYESLNKKIEYLNNKATKLGLSEITLDIVYSIGIAVPQKDGLYKEVSYLKVNVNGEPPTLEGCKLVGIIEPNINGNVIKEISDSIKIPEKYRHTDLCDCEHCGIKRERTSAFIVLIEETNEFLQVGRVCLKSYTGDRDPKNIALYESFFKLKDYAFHDNTIKQSPTYNVNELLSFLIVAKEFFPDLHQNYLENIILNRNQFLDQKSNIEFSKIRKEIALSITDDTLIKVGKLKESIFKLDNSNNNNIWNYQQIMKEEFTTQPYILLDVIEFKNAYDLKMTLNQKRLQDDILKKQKEFEEREIKKSRVHVGIVDQKLTIKVTLESVVAKMNDYNGVTLIYNFRDENQNGIVWFNNGKEIFNEDDQKDIIENKKTFYINGTVKAFKEFRDEKSTQLIRVKNLGQNPEIIEKIKKPKKTI